MLNGEGLFLLNKVPILSCLRGNGVVKVGSGANVVSSVAVILSRISAIFWGWLTAVGCDGNLVKGLGLLSVKKLREEVFGASVFISSGIGVIPLSINFSLIRAAECK